MFDCRQSLNEDSMLPKNNCNVERAVAFRTAGTKLPLYLFLQGGPTELTMPRAHLNSYCGPRSTARIQRHAES